MGSSEKIIERLEGADKKVLRKLMLAPILLALGLVVMITLVNLTLHFIDVLTGIEGVGRPPIIRFVIVELVAIVLGSFTFLFLTKKVRKDLSSQEKIKEVGKVSRKFAQNTNGKTVYKFRLDNNRIIEVERTLYSNVQENTVVLVLYAPNSGHVFDVSKES